MPATNPTHRRPGRRRSPLDPTDVNDPTTLLAFLVDAHLRTAELEPPGANQMKRATAIFKMKVAADVFEADGEPTNELDHLVGSIVRATEGYCSWTGPVPLSSLQRVLSARIEWEPPSDLDASVVLDRFAAAPIVGVDATVADILRWAFTKNLAVPASKWPIDGLPAVVRPRSRSIQSFEATPGLALKYLSTSGPEVEPVADPTAPYAGLYEMCRERVHGLVFDESTPRPRPQILPKHPGILLSVAYVLEYLIVWDRPDAEVPAELTGPSHDTWRRLCMPAASRLDPQALINQSQKLSERMAEAYPWLLQFLPGWDPAHDPAGEEDS